MRAKWLQYGAAGLIVHLATACSQSETPPPPPKQETHASANTSMPIAEGKLVLAFGDSLYAGYNLDQGKGLAPVLERSLNAAGVKAQVVNAGVSGDTTAAGLARLVFTLDGLPRKPDLALVGLGGNDMLRGLAPSETRKNLDAILAELRKRNIPVVLTGMIASPNMGPDYAAAFNPIYPDLARKYDAGLYPFMLNGVIGNRSLLLEDGIHPNPKGVETIVKGLEPLVAEKLHG